MTFLQRESSVHVVWGREHDLLGGIHCGDGSLFADIIHTTDACLTAQRILSILIQDGERKEMRRGRVRERERKANDAAVAMP